jgi:hypothetical protein
MSCIPDCREDENYNEKYLNNQDHEFVRGYDWCVQQAVDNFFDNEMFDLMDESSHLGHILCEELPESLKTEYLMERRFPENEKLPDEERKVETYADLIRYKILEWIENERNELITSMIDAMDDEEYKKIKEKADSKKEQ